MEPFSALGAAANVVQFIQLGFEIFIKTKEISKSAKGTTKEFESIQQTAERLDRYCIRLQKLQNKKEFDVGTGNLHDFNVVVSDCCEMAQQLSTTLNQLKRRDSSKRLQSLRTALEGMWKKSEIRAMEKALFERREELFQILAIMRDEQQSNVLSNLRGLTETGRQLGLRSDPGILDLREDVLSSVRDLENVLTGAEICYVLNNKSLASFLRAPRGTTFATANATHENETDINCISERIAQVENRQRKIDIHLKALSDLKYDSMEMRHSSIPEAYLETFQWIIGEAENAQIDLKFVDWLQSPDPLYWISGKPGSGKSTLMKFIADNPKTRTLLEKWAAGDHLVVASHYFWINGTDMQKSQEGLLRSLLYEMLKYFPDFCYEAYSPGWHALDFFHILLKEHFHSGYKFCFFIDGLDEYSGDHHDIIQMIKQLISSPSIKVCIASRPWNIFENAFGGDLQNKLYLQHLNYDDIKTYVLTKLQASPKTSEMTDEDDHRQEIVNEIIEKAQGVFLWVFLVVRSVLEGIENCDRLIDLRRRVEQFPADLDDYFRHMIMSIDTIYRPQTVRSFQLALNAKEPLSILAYWYLDEEEVNPEFWRTVKIGWLSLDQHDKCLSMCLQASKRLNARCKGLLWTQGDGNSNLKRSTKVEFLHRTVRDFLLTKGVQDLLNEWTTTDFKVDETILKITLAEVKGNSSSPPGNYDSFWNIFQHHAWNIEILPTRFPVELLDDLINFVDSFPPNQRMCLWLVDVFLSKYIDYRFRKDMFGCTLQQSEKLASTMLGQLLSNYDNGVKYRFESMHGRSSPNPVETLKILLSHGADPNRRARDLFRSIDFVWLIDEIRQSTLWENFLHCFHKGSTGSTWQNLERFEVFKLMLLHGAARDITLPNDNQYNFHYTTRGDVKFLSLLEYLREKFDRADFLELQYTIATLDRAEQEKLDRTQSKFIKWFRWS